MQIRYIDPIYSEADKRLIHLLRPCLSYNKVYWKPGRYGRRQRHEYTAYMIDRDGRFLTGLTPRIKQQLKSSNGIKWNTDNYIYLKPESKPRLENIDFRDDQKRLIGTAIEKQRGVLVSPTGSGKTILMLGIMSCYSKANILMLCHSISILNQTKTEILKFGFNKVNFIGGGVKEGIKEGVTVASIQSFSKMDLLKYCDFFDIVFVDETHHCNSLTSQYGKVLQTLLAPMRIGFTATVHTDKEKLLSLEGLIGPVIDEVTINEGVKNNILAKPKLTLLPVKFNEGYNRLSYREIYRRCIVNNRYRNKAIVKYAIEKIYEGKTCLILIKEIAHGENILKIVKAFKSHRKKFIFIKGATEKDAREDIRKSLDDKEIKCVIATAVWREGINVRTLNTVINACGGNSEIMTMQAIGRGLRTAPGKDVVEIVDFLDPYRYLSAHAIQRMSMYSKAGWL